MPTIKYFLIKAEHLKPNRETLWASSGIYFFEVFFAAVFATGLLAVFEAGLAVDLAVNLAEVLLVGLSAFFAGVLASGFFTDLSALTSVFVDDFAGLFVSVFFVSAFSLVADFTSASGFFAAFGASLEGSVAFVGFSFAAAGTGLVLSMVCTVL